MSDEARLGETAGVQIRFDDDRTGIGIVPAHEVSANRGFGNVPDVAIEDERVLIQKISILLGHDSKIEVRNNYVRRHETIGAANCIDGEAESFPFFNEKFDEVLEIDESGIISMEQNKNFLPLHIDYATFDLMSCWPKLNTNSGLSIR